MQCVIWCNFFGCLSGCSFFHLTDLTLCLEKEIKWWSRDKSFKLRSISLCISFISLWCTLNVWIVNVKEYIQFAVYRSQKSDKWQLEAFQPLAKLTSMHNFLVTGNFGIFLTSPQLFCPIPIQVSILWLKLAKAMIIIKPVAWEQFVWRKLVKFLSLLSKIQKRIEAQCWYRWEIF